MLPETAEAVGLVLSVDLRSRTVSQGTGFMVSPDGLLVTSLHVVLPSYEDKGNPVLVIFIDASYFGDIVCVDEAKDIALLRVPAEGRAFLKIGSMKNLREGDRVFTLSYPGRGRLMFSEGYVDKIYGGGRVSFVITSAPLSFGSSGGPIMNSKGEVIGVAAFVIFSGEGEVRSMGVASDHIRDLLERCGDKN